MKKIVLSLLAAGAFAMATKAQNFGFQKNDVILEGSAGVNFTDNKNTETKMSSFTVSPKLGYFATDKFAIGIAPSYTQSKTTNYSGTEDAYNQTNTLGVSLFGRYYFLEAGARFKFYGDLGLGYSASGGENAVGGVTTKLSKTNTFGINGGVGANYFVTPGIAIGYRFSNVIGFSSSKVDTDGAKPLNSFYANLNSFQNFFNSGQFSLTFKL